ncbi:MAG: AI-2E family transporter [Anaerolineae bacterium]|nr:AI-2E family transporter [Anaerolineae bacterium]
MNKVVQKWDASAKRTVVLILLLLLALLIYRFRAILLPLILAFLTAFILNPVVDFVEKHTRMNRGVAAAIVLLVVILLLAAAPVVAVPMAQKAILSLNLDFANIVDNLDDWIAQPITFWGREWDLRSLYEDLRQTLQSFLSTVADVTVDVVVGFASGIFWLVFILLSAFYMVKDGDRIIGWLDDLAPLSFREDLVALRLRITEVWNAFLRGQLLMALFLMVITTVVAAAVGLPNALALGILAGAMEFIPNLGPIIAAVPAVLLAFFSGSSWLPLSNFWFAVLVLGLYLIIQQIEGNILLPRIMGQSLNLHPLIVLVAIIGGGSLAGILGVLIAAPMVATARVLIDYLFCRLTDRDPFPERDKPPPPRFGRSLWNRVRKRLWTNQWRPRPAHPDDRAGVEEICAQVWEGDDYVPKVWDEWLADPHGELSVVERKGKVVALGKLTRIADDEWWLEGLRVHPAYRYLGVASAMQEHQIAVAQRVASGKLRLGTASHNKAVQHMALRDGFQQVAEFQFCEAAPLPGPCAARRLTGDDLEALWALVAGSDIFHAVAGLYEVNWHWMSLTAERMAAHLRAGEAWGVELEGKLAAIAIVPHDEREEPRRLTVSYIDGTMEGITALAWCLRVLAKQLEREELRIRPVAHPPLLAALHAADVVSSRDHALLVFERSLAPGEAPAGEPAEERPDAG